MWFGHGLLAWWSTTWHHRHRSRLETLWSTLVLLIRLLSARHRHHLLWGASHRHLWIESSLRWALVIVLPLLLHILCLWLLIWVSLIASTTDVVVVILVLSTLVVHVLTAVTLPWLLLLVLLLIRLLIALLILLLIATASQTVLVIECIDLIGTKVFGKSTYVLEENLLC